MIHVGHPLNFIETSSNTTLQSVFMVRTLILVALGLVVVALLVLYLLVLLFSHSPRNPFESELYFITTEKDGSKSAPLPLPVANSPSDGTIELSVVIPCYNETSRLKLMFDDSINYLKETLPDRFEILIVDDGSKDSTDSYALDLAHNTYNLKPGQLRVIKFEENRGKGGAVIHGLQHIRGEYGIFADADGASSFKDMSKLLAQVKNVENKNNDKIPAIAIGSRAHMVNTDAVVKRSFIRNFLMYGLHMLVYVFGIRQIKDTQCGFKLFNKSSIALIFPFMHTEGWIFDVEILIIALRKGISVSEVPISWHEVDGSKMDLARDSMNMAIDLVVTRMAYILGIYKDSVVTKTKVE